MILGGQGTGIKRSLVAEVSPVAMAASRSQEPIAGSVAQTPTGVSG
jgi:hypothetical protein